MQLFMDLSLQQSLFAALTKDLSSLGTRMGMVVAVASLTGSPTAGAFIDNNRGRYLGAQLWGFLMIWFETSVVVLVNRYL